MELMLAFNHEITYNKIISDILANFQLKFNYKNTGELELLTNLDVETLVNLKELFSRYGITVINDEKTALVLKIKETITKVIKGHDNERLFTMSTYLSEKLDYSYAHLSQVFSEITYTSIENFIILKKIDFVKEMLLQKELSLTEIAYKLHYSSVAHLSNQFKKTTGLTPTAFKKIIERRKLKHK